MIGKLRRRFILINMALVSLVLAIALGAVLFFNYQWLKGETEDVLRKTLEAGERPEPQFVMTGKDDRRFDNSLLPAFVVRTDQEGEIVSISKADLGITDEVIDEIASKALEAGRPEGALLEYSLRYLIRETPDGAMIAFADMGREIDGIRNLSIMLLLAGAGGLAAFFLISVFLSNMALRPVEKAWEQQRRFVADASHELRTPLTVILANMGILLSHRQDTIGRQLKWVEHTKAEAERMKKLVEDLLFLAKSDAAIAPLVKSEMDLGDAILSCLLPFESVAYEQGVKIESDIAPDISVIGDEGKLKQLMVILLDNACKYAGENGIIAVRLERVQGTAKLSVHNTGEPIPPEHLEHVFKRFYRSDTARARRDPDTEASENSGYGLGLSIAQTIVENHGGKITVASSGKEGTTFLVQLPIKV